VIKQHPRLGQIFVRQVRGLEEISDAVLHHHERYDGTAIHLAQAATNPAHRTYPAVADGYSAMTTDRPYRKAMPERRLWPSLGRGRARSGIQRW